MGVFQTPKQFLPGVDRASARTTPALPAKSHAAPPLFACKRGRREFRASETRPSKSNASETWLVGSAVANNLFRKRARTLFLSGLQSLYKIPAGEAQRDFPALSGHRLKSRSALQRRDFPVPRGHPPRLFLPALRLISLPTVKNRQALRSARRFLLLLFSLHCRADQSKEREVNSCGGTLPHQLFPVTAPSRRPGARCRPPRG